VTFVELGPLADVLRGARDTFATEATTSPVESRPRTAGPARAAWCETTWASRNEARSQFHTANRCRITPATATTSPSPSSMAAHWASARLSCSTIPSSIARPIVNGISAWATIQRTPKPIPASRVPTW
jgi:hypothetical protein